MQTTTGSLSTMSMSSLSLGAAGTGVNTLLTTSIASSASITSSSSTSMTASVSVDSSPASSWAPSTLSAHTTHVPLLLTSSSISTAPGSSLSHPPSSTSSLLPSFCSASYSFATSSSSQSSPETKEVKEIKKSEIKEINEAAQSNESSALFINFQVLRGQIEQWSNKEACTKAVGYLQEIATCVVHVNQFLKKVDQKLYQDLYQKLYFPAVLTCIELMERKPICAIKEMNLCSSVDDAFRRSLVQQLQAPITRLRATVQHALLTQNEPYSMEQQRARTLALCSQQGLIESNAKLREKCTTHFKAISQLVEKENADLLNSRCFISYAWPTSEHRETTEKWVQPFLKILHSHLKAAGIRPILDIVDNRAGKNIYHFMEQIEETEFTILFCTESLFDKHHDERVLAIQTELKHIDNKHNIDISRDLVRIFPYLISGSHVASYPERFKMYSTVRDWRDNSYLENLKQLISLIYYPQGPSLEYNQLWEEFYKKDNENDALRRVMPSEAVQTFQKQKVHEKEYEQLCRENFYRRLLQQQERFQLLAEQQSSSAPPVSTEMVLSPSSSFSFPSTFSAQKDMATPKVAPHLDEMKLDAVSTAACTSISTSSIQVRSASTYTDQKEVKTTPLLIQVLRDLYLEMSTKAISLFVENKCLSLHDCFINLAIVCEEAQRKREKEIVQREGKEEKKDQKSAEAFSKSIQDTQEDFMSSIETINQPSEPILLDDLFKCRQQETKEPKRILVEGLAGIGKTILSRYLAYQWALGNESAIKVMREFYLTLLVPLRQLLQRDESKLTTPQSLKTEVARFLHESVFGDATRADFPFELFQKELESLEGQPTLKILYLLDGYDEVQDVHQDSENSLRKEILNALLVKPHCLVTSRPDRVAAELRFDRRLKNIGFTEENIQLYIQRFFSLTTGMEAIVLVPSFQQLLSAQSSIQWIAHIPLVLELLCSLWKNKSVEDSPLSEQPTLTEVYTAIINYMQKRFLIKTQASGITEKSSMEVVQRHSQCQRLNKALKEIAWQGVEQKQMILLPKIIQPAIDQKNYPELKEQTDYKQFLEQLFEKAGFLTRIGVHQTLLTEQSYSFIHLTFQEFFAARHFAHGLNLGPRETYGQEAYNFLRKNKYDRRFIMVWRFAFGLLSSDQKSTVGLSRFWQAIEEEPRDLLGLGHIALIIRCLNEARFDVQMRGQNEFLYGLNRLTQEIIINGQQLNMGNVSLIGLMRENRYVTRRSGILRFLIARLRNKGLAVKERTRVVNILSALGQGDEEVIKVLIELSLDQDEECRSVIISTLGVVAQGNKEAVNALTQVLDDESKEVKNNAIEALGRTGQGNEEVIGDFIKALRNSGTEMRWKIALALGKVGKGNEEAIKALTGELRDHSAMVKQNIAIALGQIAQGNKAAIRALIRVLGDRDDQVRQNAARGLGEIAQGNDEAIEALIGSLGDRDDQVRQNVTTALGLIAQKNKKAIRALLVFLNNCNNESMRSDSARSELFPFENKDMRPIIITALGQIACVHEGAIKELIRLLVNQDNGSALEQKIVSALGQIAQGNGEVISELIEVLKDIEARRVTGQDNRHSAQSVAELKVVKVFGQIGQGNKEAIQAVMKIFMCSFSYYPGRRDVVSALGNVGKGDKGAIEALIKLLPDSKKYSEEFLCGAIEALGEIAQGNEKVIEALIETLKDTGLSRIRSNIISSSLVKIARGNEKAIESLITAWGGGKKDSDLYIVFILKKIVNKRHEGAIKIFTSVLNDQDRVMSEHATDGLVQINPGNQELIKKIMKDFNDGDEYSRREAAHLLVTLPITPALITQYFSEYCSSQTSKSPKWMLVWLIIKGAIIQYDDNNKLHQIIVYDPDRIECSVTLTPQQYENLIICLKRVWQELNPYLPDEDSWPKSSIFLSTSAIANFYSTEEPDSKGSMVSQTYTNPMQHSSASGGPPTRLQKNKRTSQDASLDEDAAPIDRSNRLRLDSSVVTSASSTSSSSSVSFFSSSGTSASSNATASSALCCGENPRA